MIHRGRIDMIFCVKYAFVFVEHHEKGDPVSESLWAAAQKTSLSCRAWPNSSISGPKLPQSLYRSY